MLKGLEFVKLCNSCVVFCCKLNLIVNFCLSRALGQDFFLMTSLRKRVQVCYI